MTPRLLSLMCLCAGLTNLGALVYFLVCRDAGTIVPIAACGLAASLSFAATALLVLGARARSGPAPVSPLLGGELRVRFPSPVPPGESPAATDRLDNRDWVELVERCVGLFEELDGIQPGLDETCRPLAVHVSHRLVEILERSGVSVITGEQTLDRNRHRPEPSPAPISERAAVARTLSPGFAVGRRIFRRARVSLAPTPLAPEERQP
jgi:hypothetical protein